MFGIMFLSNLSIWGRIIALVGKESMHGNLGFCEVQGSDVFKIVITEQVTVPFFFFFYKIEFLFLT